MKAIALLPALALVAACSQGAKEEEPLTVHDVMVKQIDGNADPIWEITNASLDDSAAINPAKMTDEQWAEVEKRALAVKAGAETLAEMKKLVLIKPGEKISDQDVEGGSTPAKVQAHLDAAPDDFRQFAGVLEAHMADLATAAKNHDAAAATPLVDQLDGVCESCHLEFWYPEQKALVQSIRQKNGDDPTT
ncbi:cytochrome c [Croceibacterium aestuarii]|uniref:cytochrome c n=1 Tax=Croceibacterium aestuarii TaxID=3064139 RepID=UPI00272E1B9F|nr:cytochrome c [Croceibacterium sp. D39]